jgi:EAL domain-containing protein (putative c-di-GMP-specific phosphodiesterase class I)
MQNPTRLLILDDEEAVGITIGAIARSVGFEVRMTTSAENFFEAVNAWAPTHIALDLVMPNADGIEVIRRLAENGCSAGIILTSGAGNRVLEAAQRTSTEHGLQVLGVVAKPFTPSKLRGLLNAPPPAKPAKVKEKVVPAEDPFGIITERDLDVAMEARQFRVHYQPKVSCADGSLAGFEALVRWYCPDRGMVPPDRFIPLAEKTGQIGRLTQLITEMALDFMAQEFSETDLLVSINLSSRSLDAIGLADELAAACSLRGLDPSRVILELTETSAMQNPVDALDLLTRLRIKGFHLSIDDFGVGYSSLVQLARQPFSELKIDTSFVRNLVESEESRKIVKSIIGLGHSLGLRVTAEGVEDQEALNFLRYADCDLAQGYFVGRPMTAEALLEWMA